uniref:Ig-like domain-containing protein n=1 Tax=Meloidogyne hapla TaxID=6305 RepID=A0A1I8B4P4_MELHA
MNGHSYGRGLNSSSLSSQQFAANYFSFKRRGERGKESTQIQFALLSNTTQQYGSSQSQISPNSLLKQHTRNLISNQPLTKQVDQLLYEIPDFKFTKNALFQAPEFLKVFSDICCIEGSTAVFDCMILGSPRPKVCWLFNDDKLTFEDVILEDTYGSYTVLVENEAGRAITTAMLLPIK